MLTRGRKNRETYCKKCVFSDQHEEYIQSNIVPYINGSPIQENNLIKLSCGNLICEPCVFRKSVKEMFIVQHCACGLEQHLLWKDKIYFYPLYPLVHTDGQRSEFCKRLRHMKWNEQRIAKYKKEFDRQIKTNGYFDYCSFLN